MVAPIRRRRPGPPRRAPERAGGCHGDHTLRVRATGEHNSPSGASFVSIDRAEVYGG
ncbi:hypothetical protein [Streptomyces sp. CH-036]|uniref:hypothetical protein n=1 Tax=Streptomyces sp. CH-036 TaxID=3406733 RepID=UPI003C72302B